MIRGYCPACGRAYKVDDRYAGMTGRCKACGASITVPGIPDEGLNGLPPLSETTEEQPAARGESPAPQPQQPPPPPQEEKPPEPPPEDHDRFEPSHGPTPLTGSWLKNEPGTAEAAPQPEAPPRDEATLPSTRLVTELEHEAEKVPRPFLLSVASVLVVLVALGFCAHMATGHWPHRLAGGVGLVLAVLGVVRIWGGHWDGLIPAVLSCLGAGASYLVPSEVEAARTVLLAAAALALLLLVLAAARRSGRDYFAR